MKKAKEPGAGRKPSKSDALDEVKKLYRFMTEQGLDRLEFGRDDFQVRLVRRPAAPPPGVLMAAPAPHGAAAAAPPPGQSPRGLELPPGAWVVKSPMMGIFYRAASPSSPPFAKEGDPVKAGQVVCLVEAMKVFNEVKAESDGTVLRILVENGKPVQAGQELLVMTRR